MAQRSILVRPLHLLMVLALSLGLWGCGPGSPAPPPEVVAEAIAQRLAQTPTLFYGQAAPGQPAVQVVQVHTQAQRRSTFDGKPAVEVIGTYRLTGKGLSAAQRRLGRNFDIYLQHRRDPDRWLLLHPTAAAEDGTLRWRATPLNPAVTDAAEPSTPEAT